VEVNSTGGHGSRRAVEPSYGGGGGGVLSYSSLHRTDHSTVCHCV
jgi:hypothetical protein